jgi:hypothetical protein
MLVHLMMPLKELLSAVKEFELSPLMESMDIVHESARPLVPGKQEAVFEVVFPDASKILVTDDKKLFRHVLTAADPKKDYQVAELWNVVFKSLNKPLHVIETYDFPSSETGYKLKYHPQVPLPLRV